MGFGRRLRDGWLFTIKHSLNHLTGRIARGRGEHFSIIRTVGRKSGKTYETPIIAMPVEGGFICELTYGPEVDWYRNLMAANGGELVRDGVTTKIVGIERISVEEGIATFPPFYRFVLRLLRRRFFLKLVAA